MRILFTEEEHKSILKRGFHFDCAINRTYDRIGLWKERKTIKKSSKDALFEMERIVRRYDEFTINSLTELQSYMTALIEEAEWTINNPEWDVAAAHECIWLFNFLDNRYFSGEIFNTKLGTMYSLERQLGKLKI